MNNILAVILFSLLASFVQQSNGRPGINDQTILVSTDDHPGMTIDGSTQPRYPEEYGVGFDLSGSYGTVAISFANGSIFNIARVPADESYKSLMAKSSLELSQHPAPPYKNLEDLLKDQNRQLLRRVRKMLGLPASDEVAILSGMLRELHLTAEMFLGHNISSAMATTPDLIALYEEDLHDAFEYISLGDKTNQRWDMLHETEASIASYGIGLCQNYTDIDGCMEETSNMTFRNFLSVSYTRDALCVEVVMIQSVYRAWPYSNYPPNMDFTLGSDMIHHNPKEEYYWEAVRDRISQAVLPGLQLNHIPEMVLLFGESSSDPRFRQLLEEALTHLYGYLPEIKDEHPIFGPARGAAVMAMRGDYD